MWQWRHGWASSVEDRRQVVRAGNVFSPLCYKLWSTYLCFFVLSLTPLTRRMEQCSWRSLQNTHKHVHAHTHGAWTWWRTSWKSRMDLFRLTCFGFNEFLKSMNSHRREPRPQLKFCPTPPWVFFHTLTQQVLQWCQNLGCEEDSDTMMLPWKPAHLARSPWPTLSSTKPSSKHTSNCTTSFWISHWWAVWSVRLTFIQYWT